MLQKSDAGDLCAKTFEQWRAMLPVWNLEADRIRAAAVAARRGMPLDPGVIADAERTLAAIRAAVDRCDALLMASLPGDQHLPHLVNAAAEFDALIESLHASLVRMETCEKLPRRRQEPVFISRPHAATTGRMA
jgi:hypothetical protein